MAELFTIDEHFVVYNRNEWAEVKCSFCGELQQVIEIVDEIIDRVKYYWVPHLPNTCKHRITLECGTKLEFGDYEFHEVNGEIVRRYVDFREAEQGDLCRRWQKKRIKAEVAVQNWQNDSEEELF